MNCNADRLVHLLRAAEGTVYVALENYCPLPAGKAYLFKDHAQGKCFELDSSKSKLFGCDDLFVHGLSQVLVSHMNMRNILGHQPLDKNQFYGILAEFFGTYQINPFLQEAYLNHSKKPHPKNPTEENFSKLLKLIISKNCSEDPKKYVDRLKPEVLLDHLYHIGEHPTWEVIGVWRNRHMTEHIFNLYCQAARDGKDLMAIVGLFHTPGLVEMLRKKTGGKVTILERDSEDEGEELLNKIATDTSDLKNFGIGTLVCMNTPDLQKTPPPPAKTSPTENITILINKLKKMAGCIKEKLPSGPRIEEVE